MGLQRFRRNKKNGKNQAETPQKLLAIRKKATAGLAARVALAEKSVIRTDIPAFKAGDTVRVHVKIKEGEKERVQPYEGVVIARSNTPGRQDLRRAQDFARCGR